MLKKIEKDMMSALKNKEKEKAGSLRPVSYTHLTLPTTLTV